MVKNVLKSTEKQKISEKEKEFLKDLIKIDTVDSKNAHLIKEVLLDYFKKGERYLVEVPSFFNPVKKNFLFILTNSSSPYLLIDVHYDVVPVGEWKEGFKPAFENDYLIGRGASDNKGLILPALNAFIEAVEKDYKLNLILAITGDEETGHSHGAYSVSHFLKQKRFHIRDLIVLEPGKDIFLKIGARGRALASLKIYGKPSHSAYPLKQDSSVYKLVELIDLTKRLGIEGDSKNMYPTTLAITDIKSENETTNIVPGLIKVNLDIRFNLNQNEETLKSLLEKFGEVELKIRSKPYLSEMTPFTALCYKALKEEFGDIRITTEGGTSNANTYIRNLNIKSFAEFGVKAINIHSDYEMVSLEELKKIENVLKKILVEYQKF